MIFNIYILNLFLVFVKQNKMIFKDQNHLNLLHLLWNQFVQQDKN